MRSNSAEAVALLGDLDPVGTWFVDADGLRVDPADGTRHRSQRRPAGRVQRSSFPRGPARARSRTTRRPSDFRYSSAALVSSLDERDSLLRTHADEVANLAEAVGRRLGFAGERLEELRTAAQLHDIGKLGIAEAILTRPGPLTDDDWELMRRHTLIGERIVSATPSLAGVATIIRSAHERWDGAGYPDGLSGQAIPLVSRIIFVCDAFEAMTTDSRLYRTPLAPAVALAELRRSAGTQFDPFIVDEFAATLAAPRAEPLIVALGRMTGRAGRPLCAGNGFSRTR